MKKLIHMALAAAMVVGLFGAVNADSHMDEVPNQRQAGGTWYYPNIGPAHDDYGTPMMGFEWDDDYSGEVVYLDEYTVIVEADGSGDMMTFAVYPGLTRFDPSTGGVRVGSKVDVNADNMMRAKLVHVVPFHRWLAAQSK